LAFVYEIPHLTGKTNHALSGSLASNRLRNRNFLNLCDLQKFPRHKCDVYASGERWALAPTGSSDPTKINKELSRMRKMSFMVILAILGLTLTQIVGRFFGDAFLARVFEMPEGQVSLAVDGTTPYPYCWPAACASGKTKGADHKIANMQGHGPAVQLADGTTPYPFCFPRACTLGGITGAMVTVYGRSKDDLAL
jgi:hypothetical protein